MNNETLESIISNHPELTGEQPYFFYWIIERERARYGHDNKLQKPWTQDKILQQYRFCNVSRAHDTVSVWINDNWMVPFDRHQDIVFAICLARLFNRISTLELIGYPDFTNIYFDEWKEATRKKLKGYRDAGNKIWTGAYLVSTNGHSMDKVDYILDKVLSQIYYSTNETYLRLSSKTLKNFHTQLMRFDGMGSFMAGQVVADLKYTSGFRDALDWYTWAAIGPGSKRGLNRYYGKELTKSINTDQFLKQIGMVQLQVRKITGLELHAQDIQNCFCEFDKYCRTKNNEGKPRSTYRGT